MLIVDFDALRPVHVLNLVHEVLLHRFAARDTQDVVRNERTACDRVARSHQVTRVGEHLATGRNDVLDFSAVRPI